jgi:hypothetical protein
MFFGKRRKKKKEADEPLHADELDDDFGFEESSVQDPSTVRRPKRRPSEPDDSLVQRPRRRDPESDDSLVERPRRRDPEPDDSLVERPPRRGSGRRTPDPDDSLVSDASLGRGLEDATFVDAPKAPPRASSPPSATPRSTPKPPLPGKFDESETDEALPDATMFIGRAVDSTVLVVGWLVSTEGPTRGRDYRLNDGVTRVGKSPECQIRLPNDAYVSNTHATLKLAEGAYVLEDLGSTNGTLHNGARVTSRIRLEDGDQVRFGLSDFVFKSCRLG